MIKRTYRLAKILNKSPINYFSPKGEITQVKIIIMGYGSNSYPILFGQEKRVDEMDIYNCMSLENIIIYLTKSYILCLYISTIFLWIQVFLPDVLYIFQTFYNLNLIMITFFRINLSSFLSQILMNNRLIYGINKLKAEPQQDQPAISNPFFNKIDIKGSNVSNVVLKDNSLKINQKDSIINQSNDKDFNQQDIQLNTQNDGVTKEACNKKSDKVQNFKKIIVKGDILVPVDQYFKQRDSHQVFSENGIIYSITLNQSNVQYNNNKFYIIQILKSPSGDFIVFKRWGRVGVIGMQSTNIYDNSKSAIRSYRQKKSQKLNKGYKQIQMSYGENVVKQQGQQKIPFLKNEKKPQIQSKLDQKVQNLIKLIFDLKMMNSQMKEIGYDAKKMPLGKLAKSSILKGYQALNDLMNQFNGDNNSEVIASLSSTFYSYIPHDFGFSKMKNYIIDNQKKLKEKLQMLQSLENIQIYSKLLDGNFRQYEKMNKLDAHYKKLDTNITVLDRQSETYQFLLDYVQKSHGKTHSDYRVQVEDIFEINKLKQTQRFTSDIGNRQLLWHGSRLTNFVGILSRGLMIAPPQAPVTGYMFGKGVYFADMVTKSANYCCTNTSNTTGLMLLCEVALGVPNQKIHGDFNADRLPPGKHSTKGLGKRAPSSGKYLGEIFVPCGKAINSGLTNYSLQYNQYIVYNLSQIKTRYLFKMKFLYK